MKTLIFVTAAALAFGVGAAWAEQEPAETPARAIAVSHADLDLTQSQDAEAMLNRLRYASMRACAVDEVRRAGIALRRAIAQCREAALAEAVAETKSPELTRLYAEQRE